MQVVLFLCFCLLSIAAVKPAPSEIDMASYPNPNMTMTFAGSIMKRNGLRAYYLISTDKVSWDVGRKVCESSGSGNHLVEVTDEAENENIYGVLASGGHNQAWTSGNDLIKNGRYVWAKGDGKSPVPFTFTDWVKGSAPKDPDCGCVSIKSTKTGSCGSSCIGEYKWHEEDCQIKKKFLCELA